MKNWGDMPELYRNIAENEGKEKAVGDYISCMTDDYAIDRFTELCIPKSWSKNYF